MLIKNLFLLLIAALTVIFFVFGGEEVKSEETQPEAVYVYAGEGGVEVSAVSAALLDADGGRLLFAHNADQSLPMASTTKIMTAVVVLENAVLDAEYRVTKEATNIEGSSLYLCEGEVFTVEELLYGLMLESGNDAAVALAIATAGDVESFVELMNRKCAELGLRHTHFANPNGLTAEGHYTTANELARITAYALTVPKFTEICSTQYICLESDGHITRYLRNHNRLLTSYEGMFGVKTGYTMAAGRCLVTAAERNGMRLIAVTLNDRNDWADHRKMLDYGFSAYKREIVCIMGETVRVKVNGGKSETVLGYIDKTVGYCIPTDGTVTRVFDVKEINAPVEKGDVIGKLKIYGDGALIGEVPVKAASAVEKKGGSFKLWKS